MIRVPSNADFYWEFICLFVESLLKNNYTQKKWGIKKLYIGSIWIELIVAKNWKLKTENWKHCSKIIFKYVNSIVGPIFNVF